MAVREPADPDLGLAYVPLLARTRPPGQQLIRTAGRQDHLRAGGSAAREDRGQRSGADAGRR